MNTRRDTFAIVTCVNENWLAPACVTMLSVARNLKHLSAQLFIVVDSLSAQGRSQLDEFEARHGLDVNIIVSSAREFIDRDASRYSQAAYLRLYLSELLPPKFDRVLYLDSDILALQDLEPLLNSDLHGNALGAVPEIKLAPGRGVLTDWHRRQIGLKGKYDYFNSGVLLFDWPKICSENLLEQTRQLLLSRPDFPFPDQDALNLAFKDKWLALPLKWNVEQTAAFYLGIDPALRHFNHAAKPWDWRGVMGYARFNDYYGEALKGLALERFLSKEKKGSPLLANIEFAFRAASLHQRRFLRRRYAKLL